MKFSVFPAGRMCSIRRALMLWLLPLFLAVAAGSAAFSYWSYSRMVEAFMDDQMEQLAQSVALHDEPMSLPGVSEERIHQWGAYVVQVFDGEGHRLVSSWPQLGVGRLGAPGLQDVRQGGRLWRAYQYQTPGDRGRAVQVLQSGSFRSHVAAEHAGAAIVPVLVLLPLSMLVLWGIARAMSREVQDIARAAASQDEHNIAELPLDRVPQEITPLVASFNSLLRRLRDAFTAQRRFVQDAAHELRTPIAAIGLQLENLRTTLPEGACTERFAHLESGVRRAQRVVDQMLRMSRQETTAAEASALVDLQAQLHESMNTLIALADQRNIDLGLVAPQPAAVAMAASLRCVPSDLRSLIDNLIENALRYTPEGGVVDVRLLNENGRAAVEVVDTGPGIPPELLPRVFDRFFRVPGTGATGSGLGLAIAQSAARRCGLRVTLRNRDDRSGLIARFEPA